MSVSFSVAAIADRMKERVATIHGTPLELATVQVGDLSSYIAREDVSLDLPAVFVVPSATELVNRTTGSNSYTYRQDFRLLYVKEFAHGVEPQRGFWAGLDSIASTFSQDPKLNGLDLSPTGQLLRSDTRSIEWVATEQVEIARGGRADLFVGAVVVETTFYTAR